MKCVFGFHPVLNAPEHVEFFTCKFLTESCSPVICCSPSSRMCVASKNVKPVRAHDLDDFHGTSSLI